MSAEIPVAIVGIGCKFPGGADTKELYYEFLRGKVSAQYYFTLLAAAARLITMLDHCRVTEWSHHLPTDGTIRNGKV